MFKAFLTTVMVGAALTVPGVALADVPVPPPNLHGCNGVVVAVGDHPAGAPAFAAKDFGLPVNVLISETRQGFLCQHP